MPIAIAERSLPDLRVGAPVLAWGQLSDWEPRLPPCASPRRGGAQRHKANSLDSPIRSLWKEGKTGGEIATALGVPRGTVSAIVHRLREHGEEVPYRRPPTRAVHEGRGGGAGDASCRPMRTITS
jgi:Homeodomain-like domain